LREVGRGKASTKLPFPGEKKKPRSRPGVQKVGGYAEGKGVAVKIQLRQ